MLVLKLIHVSEEIDYHCEMSMMLMNIDHICARPRPQGLQCTISIKYISMIKCIIAVMPLLIHRGYCCLAKHERCLVISNCCLSCINSLWPSDAIWRQRSGSTLAQVMACCLTAPIHYLNQCWLIITMVQWYSSAGNFAWDITAISH